MTRWKKQAIEEIYTLHAHNRRSRYLDALEEALTNHGVPYYWQPWWNHDGSQSRSLMVCAEAWGRQRDLVLATQREIHDELMGVAQCAG